MTQQTKGLEAGSPGGGAGGDANPSNVITSEFRTAPPAGSDPVSAPAPHPASPALEERVQRIERQNRWLKYGLAALLAFSLFAGYEKLLPEGVVIQKTMMESKELKLLDADGNARLFLRMYSRVPVLQIMDTNGKPRMSLGLRFDDTPFIDLSDKTGRTRATFEMTEDDAPALRLFDENGDTTFKLN